MPLFNVFAICKYNFFMSQILKKTFVFVKKINFVDCDRCVWILFIISTVEFL